MSASPVVLASVALVGFWLIELFLRKGSSARSWRASAVDRGSTVAIVLAYVFIAAALIVQVRGPRLPPWAQWLGALLAIVGVAVRAVAFRTLGSSYSRTLRVTEEQALVTYGIYRFVRHPGYSSAILIWCGAGAASGSVLAFTVVATVLVAVYVYRIGAEERMLMQSYGAEYQQYQARSWRLLPYVY
jgi:protein-S-isoprenylcysteine O-methyltransferase Ste14